MGHSARRHMPMAPSDPSSTTHQQFGGFGPAKGLGAEESGLWTPSRYVHEHIQQYGTNVGTPANVDDASCLVSCAASTTLFILSTVLHLLRRGPYSHTDA